MRLGTHRGTAVALRPFGLGAAAQRSYNAGPRNRCFVADAALEECVQKGLGG